MNEDVLKKSKEMFKIRNLPKLAQHLNKFNSAFYFTSINPCTHPLLNGKNGSVISKAIDTQTTCIAYRFISYSFTKHSDKSSASNQTQNIGDYDTLTEYNAYDMIHKLSDNERASLSKALSKYNSDKTKSKFQGEL